MDSSRVFPDVISERGDGSAEGVVGASSRRDSSRIVVGRSIWDDRSRVAVQGNQSIVAVRVVGAKCGVKACWVFVSLGDNSGDYGSKDNLQQ